MMHVFLIYSHSLANRARCFYALTYRYITNWTRTINFCFLCDASQSKARRPRIVATLRGRSRRTHDLLPSSGDPTCADCAGALPVTFNPEGATSHAKNVTNTNFGWSVFGSHLVFLNIMLTIFRLDISNLQIKQIGDIPCMSSKFNKIGLKKQICQLAQPLSKWGYCRS